LHADYPQPERRLNMIARYLETGTAVQREFIDILLK